MHCATVPGTFQYPAARAGSVSPAPKTTAKTTAKKTINFRRRMGLLLTDHSKKQKGSS
jgi:hypothetical protein